MVLPREIIRISDKDAWISNLIPAMVLLLTCYLYYRLAAAYPGKHLFEISVLALGRVGGRVFNSIILLHFGLLIIRDLNLMSKFINITLLTETPVSAILFAMVGVVLYFGRLGVEDHARVNEIIYPIFLVLILALPFMLSSEISFQRMEPFMTEGLGNLLASGMVNYGWLGDIIVMGAFLHTLSQASQIHAVLRNGLLTSILLLTLVQGCIILALGSNLGEIMVFPVYTLTQQISLTEFLDRVELIVYAVWLPITILKVIIVYGAFQIGFSHMLRTKKKQVYNLPLGLLMVILSLVMMDTMAEAFHFSLYTSIVHTVVTQALLYVMVAIAWIRHKSRFDSARLSEVQRRWTIRTNILIFCSFAPVIAGYMMAHDFIIAGMVASALHFGFKILFVLSSRKEVHAAREASRQ